MKILIVDDEKSIRLTLGEFLRREGYAVESAVDAETALSMRPEFFDIIITDVIMPRISGIELLKRVRERCDNVQIIIMTGEPTVDTAVMAVREGAYDYLIKPINKENLIRTVRQAAHLKSLNDEKLRLELANQQYQKNLEILVKNRTGALQKAMQSIIYLLSSVVELRDPYTAGHQRRVGNLASAIAQAMDMNTYIVEYIRIIGYIHDIGKIVIPSDILAKPGKLNALEMEMIKIHSTQGYEMLSKVDLPPIIGETVYQHHERLNGSGYPRGLSGNSILKEAQVIIVADVVEAMMSHRPYRPALGTEAALDEIRANSGILYRPEVVDACVELFEKNGYVIDDAINDVHFPIGEG